MSIFLSRQSLLTELLSISTHLASLVLLIWLLVDKVVYLERFSWLIAVWSLAQEGFHLCHLVQFPLLLQGHLRYDVINEVAIAKLSFNSCVVLVFVDDSAFQQGLQISWSLRLFAFDAIDELLAVKLGKDIRQQVLCQTWVLVFCV